MRSQQGFSLMELLAALVILTIVIMTTLAVFSERRNRLNQASELILAYQVLANEAELERRIPFDEVIPMTAFTTSTDLIKPLQPYTAKIDVASTKGGVKDVTLSLTWHKGERNAKLIIERVDTGGGNLW